MREKGKHRQEGTKVIFLDIDGVLNYQLMWEEKVQHLRHKELPADTPKGAHDICEKKVKLLNELIRSTDAKVVVSSSWRKNRSVESLQEVLDYKGFKGEIIGKTPYLNFAFDESFPYNYSVPRGCEIKAWLETNKVKLNTKMSKVKYVILDDDSDMLYCQREQYFRIDGHCG